MCLLLFVLPLSSLKNVLQRTLPTPSQQGLSSDEEGTGSQFFSQKPSELPKPAAKRTTKKEPRAIRNELLWTLKFYSVLALNAALKETILGAELGWFWVGQDHLMCLLLFVWALSSLKNVHSAPSQTQSQRPPNRACPKNGQAPALNFFSQKPSELPRPAAKRTTKKSPEQFAMNYSGLFFFTQCLLSTPL
jgi:hypothetical protein